MPFSNATIRILLASLFLASLPSTPAIAQEADPISAGNNIIEQLRTELNKKLNPTVEVKFKEVPLREAVTDIADQVEADVVIADMEIEEGGLTSDSSVTCVLKHTKLPAREALELVLRSTGLEAVNREGILWITTATQAEEILYIRVYDVQELVESFVKTIEISPIPQCKEESGGNSGGMMGPRFCTASDCLQRFGGSRGLAVFSLISAIQSKTTGPWFNFEGTGGQIKIFDGQLVITQTAENHTQIQKILDELRSNQGTPDHEQEAVEGKDTFHQPVASPLPTY